MTAMEYFVRLAVNISALGITVLVAGGCGPPAPPSDASIIARFNAHRAEFSQLLEMFDYDGINGRLGCADSVDDADEGEGGLTALLDTAAPPLLLHASVVYDSIALGAPLM